MQNIANLGLIVTADSDHCNTDQGLKAASCNDLSGLLDPSNYLTGRDAEVIHNQLVYECQQRLDHGQFHDWRIIDGVRDKKRFHRGKIDAEGNWRGYRLKKKNGRYVESGPELTGDDIRAFAKEHGNGVWHLPQAPFLHPLADDCHPTNVLKGEWDTTDTDPKNWLWVQVLESFKAKRFAPNAITSSGGKCDGLSPHPEWHFATTVDGLNHAYLRHVLVCLGADPGALDKRMSQFRKPGFYRHSREREQGLFKEFHSTAYDLREWVNCAIAVGKELGIEVPTPQEWHQAQAEKAEKAAQSSPVDLSQFEGSDIEKLLVEVDQQCPSYSPGGGSYPYRFKLYGAAHALVGDDARNLCPNMFDGCNFGALTQTNTNPIGTIVNQIRLLLGNSEWQLPIWWISKYRTQTSSKNGNNFDLEAWKTAKRKQYKKLKTLTPDVVVNQKYISNIELPSLDGLFLLIKSALGTGKTELIKRIIEKFYRDTSLDNDLDYRSSHFNLCGGALLGSRNGLLLQTCEKTKEIIVHLNSNKRRVNFDDGEEWIAACVDSILKVPVEWWEGKIIVIDEIQSVLLHLLFSRTLLGKREEVIDRFIHALRVARGVLCLDGHLNDMTVKFMRAIADDKQVKIIANEYKAQRPKLHFLDAAIDGERVKPNDYSPWLLSLDSTLRKSPFGVCSDSRIFLKSLHHRYQSLGYDGLLITSETAQTKLVKEFLRNPVSFINKYKPAYIFYSPTAESGLDINLDKYFKKFYAFFFGVISTDTQRQMLMRLRDIQCPRFVWLRQWSIVPDSTFTRNYDKSEILSYLVNECNLVDLDDPAAVIDSIKDRLESFPAAVMTLANQFRAIAEHERINFRECFLESTAHDGYQIERHTLPSAQAIKDQHKESTDAVKDQESLEIFNAPDWYLDDPYRVLSEEKMAITEHRRALEKAQIVAALPGIMTRPEWSPEFIRFIRFTRPGILAQRRRYVMATNLDLSQKLGHKRYAHDLHQSGLCPWEMRHEYLESKAIAASGILEFLNRYATAEYDAQTPELLEIAQACNRAKLYKALGRSPGKDPTKFVNWLIGRLGYSVNSKKVKRKGQTIRVYQINKKDLDPFEYGQYFNIIDELILRRLNDIVLTQPVENLAKKVDVHFSDSDNPEMPSEQGFDAVADQPTFPIRSDQGSATEKSQRSYQSKIDIKNHDYSIGQKVSYPSRCPETFQLIRPVATITGVEGDWILLSDGNKARPHTLKRA